MTGVPRSKSPRRVTMAAMHRVRARVMNQLSIGTARVSAVLNYLSPILTKFFHVGMIPLVLFLGVRSTDPRLKLVDLILPM
jgi:hypothetical protein